MRRKEFMPPWGKGRRFSVEEKLRILEEARQPKSTVPEVLRHYGLEGTTLGGDAGGAGGERREDRHRDRE